MFRNAMITAGSLAALLASSVSASAHSSSCGWLGGWFGWRCDGGSGGSGSQVPEIDATTGLLAVAALGAALALAWEVKRLRSGKS